MRKQRDIDYHYRKRIEDKERAFDDRMEAYKEKNIEPLCMHGSYYRFLCFGSPRSTYYGCSLGSVEEVEEWTFLENKINNEIMMGTDFFKLSKKIAAFFRQLGISKKDVIHLIIGNHNITFPILGGIWHIGGVCSISDTTTDEKTMEIQVRKIKK